MRRSWALIPVEHSIQDFGRDMMYVTLVQFDFVGVSLIHDFFILEYGFRGFGNFCDGC
jgi:hypothetical protein